MPDDPIVKPKQDKAYWRQYYLAHKAERIEKKRLWRLANKEKRQAAQKRWREKHPDQQKISARRRYANRRPKALEYRKQYGDLKPEVIAAHNAVGHALRNGTMTRPESCSKCGKKCTPEAHHHNGYAQEHWLNVEWLCGKCHKSAHAQLRLQMFAS